MPNHFYSPIPDTRAIDRRLFETDSELPGIDMREAEQLRFINELAGAYRREYALLPRTRAQAGSDGFYLNNGFFESGDAEVLYSYIRWLKPRRLIEIGSGFSTLVTLRAAHENEIEGKPLSVTCVEPYPRDFIKDLAHTGHVSLINEPVQNVPVSRLTDLAAGNVLFIDSSHVLRTGSDVQFEFLELLPRLADGVHVHIHDIFMPREYPAAWILKRHLFLNEQYLLQAFLTDNSRFEVMLGLAFLHSRHPEVLRSLLDSFDPARSQPGSFWMRRLGGREDGGRVTTR